MKILPRIVYFGLQTYSETVKLFKKPEISPNHLDQDFMYDTLSERLENNPGFYDIIVTNYLKQCANQYYHSKESLATKTIDTLAETAAKVWLDKVISNWDEEGCSAVSSIKNNSTFKDLGNMAWYYATIREEEKAIEDHFQRKADLEDYLEEFIPYFSQLMNLDKKTEDKLKEVPVLFKRDVECLDYREYRGLMNRLALFVDHPLHFNHMRNCIFVGKGYQELFDEHKHDVLFKLVLSAEMGHAAVQAIRGRFISDPVDEFYDLCSQVSVLKDHNYNEEIKKFNTTTKEGAKAYLEFHKDIPSFISDFYNTVIRGNKEKSFLKRLGNMLDKRTYDTYRPGELGHDGAKFIWHELKSILKGNPNDIEIILDEAKRALYDFSVDFEDKTRFLEQMKGNVLALNYTKRIHKV